MEYVFTLKFQLDDADGDVDALLERLGAAGCDDALAGIGVPGRLALAFTRPANSAKAAMLAALADVRSALPGARLIEAVPDMVGLSDVAEAAGVSRQNMRKLMLSHGPAFPPPIHDGSTALWHLDDMLAWLHEKGGYALDPMLLEVARMTRQVNLARDTRHAQPALQKTLLKALHSLVE